MRTDHPVDDGRGVVDGAVRAVLTHLEQRTGLRLWLFARRAGDEWVVEQSTREDGELVPGARFRWLDTYCAHMVEGRTPRAAPRAAEVPAYAHAGINRSVRVGAYLGVPVRAGAGGVAATLCALEPEPQDDAGMAGALPLVELCADLLSRLLALDEAQERLRAAVREAEERSRTDGLTGLANRRAWDEAVRLEEARCARTGAPAAVVSIDLDGLKRVNDREGHSAGDELLRRAARAMTPVLRSQDLIARLGGDEFAVLATDCDEQEAQAVVARLSAALEAAGVAASVAAASRQPGTGLDGAWQEADRAMYLRKAAGR